MFIKDLKIKPVFNVLVVKVKEFLLFDSNYNIKNDPIAF